jgi:hypothetical protein
MENPCSVIECENLVKPLQKQGKTGAGGARDLGWPKVGLCAKFRPDVVHKPTFESTFR